MWILVKWEVFQCLCDFKNEKAGQRVVSQKNCHAWPQFKNAEFEHSGTRPHLETDAYDSSS